MNKQTAILIAITSTTVQLTKTKTKVEETYEYKVGEQTVKFHANPKRAWAFVILEGDGKLAEKVINAQMRAGFRPDDIKTLELK